ncbi:SSI family serine proteinase inhibitor [Catenulispora subtropica]|uniref:Subtilisin inhibitor domain-containing protein n=1 Tax=Catenulispora subtropica TaxID=450798 RepID=A0ABN2RQ26_9ACTN
MTISIVRRAGAAAAAALLSGAVAAAGAPSAAAASFHVIGGFHLKRVQSIDGRTETALLLCESSSFGARPGRIHGFGNLKDPTAACAELAAAHGDFAALDVHPTWLAPMLMAPVHVEAHGTWKGAEVHYAHDFPNNGALAKQSGDVFAF